MRTTAVFGKHPAKVQGKKLKKLLILMCCLLLGGAGTAGAHDVVAVKSFDIKPFNQAIQGFRNSCGCSLKEILLSEGEETKVKNEILKERPRVVFAVGAGALALVKDIEGLPVIYTMVSNPQAAAAQNENIAGISIDVPPERVFSELRRLIPDVKRVGLLYDSRKTSFMVRDIIKAAKTRGITIVEGTVSSPRSVISKINAMKNKIDVFWMLPDSTVIVPETVEYMLLFSLENSIPVITFAEKYVEMGALMSLSINPLDAGKHAGEMARKVINGEGAGDISKNGPAKVSMTINSSVARNLGVTLSNEVVTNSRVIGREVR